MEAHHETQYITKNFIRVPSFKTTLNIRGGNGQTTRTVNSASSFTFFVSLLGNYGQFVSNFCWLLYVFVLFKQTITWRIFTGILALN